jgi:hypothetical protein
MALQFITGARIPGGRGVNVAADPGRADLDATTDANIVPSSRGALAAGDGIYFEVVDNYIVCALIRISLLAPRN